MCDAFRNYDRQIIFAAKYFCMPFEKSRRVSSQIYRYIIYFASKA